MGGLLRNNWSEPKKLSIARMHGRWMEFTKPLRQAMRPYLTDPRFQATFSVRPMMGT